MRQDDTVKLKSFKARLEVVQVLQQLAEKDDDNNMSIRGETIKSIARRVEKELNWPRETIPAETIVSLCKDVDIKVVTEKQRSNAQHLLSRVNALEARVDELERLYVEDGTKYYSKEIKDV